MPESSFTIGFETGPLRLFQVIASKGGEAEASRTAFGMVVGPAFR